MANEIKNIVLTVGCQNWLVKEAKSMEDAMNAINASRCSGSVATTQILDRTMCGGTREILADVVITD